MSGLCDCCSLEPSDYSLSCVAAADTRGSVSYYLDRTLVTEPGSDAVGYTDAADNEAAESVVDADFVVAVAYDS